MKALRLLLFLLIFIFVTYNNVSAQKIEIKGLYIGMPRELAEPIASTKPFTIAGIESINGNPFKGLVYEFENDKLSFFDFYFDSTEFNIMLSVIKKKFSGIKCEKSNIKNLFGAVFEKNYCTIMDKNSVLKLINFQSNDMKTSVLSLYSTKVVEDAVDDLKKRESDI